MILDLLSTAVRDLGDIILPSCCAVCGRMLRSPTGERASCADALRFDILCSRCTPTLPPAGWLEPTGLRCVRCFTVTSGLDRDQLCYPCRIYATPWGTLRYLWEYEGAARALITVMKYRPSYRLCRIAGVLAGAVTHELDWSLWDAIVPMPASAHSRAVRGFNQCEVIATQLRGAALRSPSTGSAPPLERMILRHHGGRPAQASLGLKQRMRNVRQLFSAGSGAVGKRVLLVDDVITSGATVWAASVALLEAGAHSVELFTLARGAAWHESRAALQASATPGGG